VEAVVERDLSGNVSYYEPGKGGVGAVAGAVGGAMASCSVLPLSSDW